MKRLLIILIFQGFISISCFSQTGTKSFSVNGVLANASNQKVYFDFQDFSDSLVSDKNGSFHYQTEKLLKPENISFSVGNRFNIPVYAAPGYNLKINADAQNRDSFMKSLKIEGIGSRANEFWKALEEYNNDSPVRMMSNAWYEIPAKEFVEKGLNEKNYQTILKRIKNELFSGQNQEPYAAYFKDYSLKVLKYNRVWLLFKYVEMNDTEIRTTDSLISQITSVNLTDMLNKDAFLDNGQFKSIIGFDYPDYMVRKRAVESKNNFGEWTYPVEIADNIYTGKVRDYAMDHLIKVAIRNSFNLNNLDFLKPFVEKTKDGEIRGELNTLLRNREMQLSEILPGMPAPDFNLPDESGRTYRLSSLRGKVVLIDLWASWCAPCKVQMPYLKKIKNRFDNRKDFQLISIAIQDENGKAVREKFIKKNNFKWLHLVDENDFVDSAYKIRLIPRFVLIGKDGKVISPDAPFPKENMKELTGMIEEALGG